MSDVDKRIDESSAERMRTVQSYLNGDWLGMAGTRQTYDRLVRKGHREEAEELLKMADQTARAMESSGLEAFAFPEIAARADKLEQIGQVVLEAVIGVNDIMPVAFLHEGSRKARSIGRIIHFPRRNPNGSGFLISPRLLLTNNHVLADAEAANKNIVQFNYYERGSSSQLSPVEFRFRPEEFFLTSPAEVLDFCLVAVEPVNAEGASLHQFGWNNLIAELGKAQQGERLNVIHHPQGRPQQVTIRENFLALILDRFLHYVTDTEPGSSGSPVFNDEWEVVALHHASRLITDPQEVSLYMQVLHGLQPAGLPTTSQFVTVNEGIRVSQLIKNFKDMMAALRPEQRPLLEEVIRAVPPPDDPVTSLPIPISTTRPENTLHIDPAGTATWTIPLQVSVSLGTGLSPLLPAMPVSSPVVVTAPVASQVSALELELYQNEIEGQKSVFRALAFLQESREGDYLPAEQEIETRKQAYYGPLLLDVQNNMDPAALYDSLHEILSSTLSIVDSFPERLTEMESLSSGRMESTISFESAQYDRARAHLYTWIDLHEDRMLHGIYTGVILAPEQLMLNDLIIQLGHKDLLPQRFSSNQYLNCEHIVPQSWFNHHPLGVSDLHHLITADGQANNFRTDCAYRSLNGTGEEGPSGRPDYIPAAGRRAITPTTKHFEPARGKPVVARATLYFLITHKGMIDSSKYNAEQIEVLKEWAKSEPPSRYELHRNEEIFKAQGNRNPLIDFPEWIDRIDFTRGVTPV